MAKIRSRPLQFAGKGVKAKSTYQKTAKQKLVKAAEQRRESLYTDAQKRARKARYTKQYRPPAKLKPIVVPKPSGIVVAPLPIQAGVRQFIDVTPSNIVPVQIGSVFVPAVNRTILLKAPAGAAARTVLAAKRAKRKAGKQKATAGVQKGRVRHWLSNTTFGRPFSSSWVDGIGYDTSTNTLAAELSGVVYAWSPVDVVVYQAWWTGAAVCVTEDPTGQARWYPGKTPSLGAMWHHGGIKRQLMRANRVM